MWSDYFFYLMGLPEVERKKQVLIMIGFWCVLLFLGFLADNVKKKINKK